MPENRWTSADHVNEYLGIADAIPHRAEGEAALLEFLPSQNRRFLYLGTGDCRILSMTKRLHQEAQAVGLDFSPSMLERARQRFANDKSVSIVTHNLDDPLPALGKFDAVISCFAIHHLVHERKRILYAEIFQVLNEGGVFCNLEHVASSHENLARGLPGTFGNFARAGRPSNKLLDVGTQLEWLADIGFTDVDCLWKWRELALMAGRIPSLRSSRF